MTGSDSRTPGRLTLGGHTLQTIAIASGIGIVTGLVVLGVEHAVDAVLEEILEGPVWVPAVSVGAGAVLTALVVTWFAGGRTATTEVYVEDYHHDDPELEIRRAPGRIVAAFTTLASGAPLGMEGPAVYSGSALGTLAWRRWPEYAESATTFLVAGAAAGVAAVFKAPLAGVLFAIEVPYRTRVASDRLLPAMLGSAMGFITMAIVDGVEPENPLPAPELTMELVAWSLILGAVVGVVALGVIALVNAAEHRTEGVPILWRAAVAGGALAGIYALGRLAADEPVGIASGNQVIDWVLSPDHGVWLLVLVLVLRVAGPAVSIAGGGVGGLFIPLMAMGAVVGRLFGDAVQYDDLTVYVLVGAATMLGTGYAAPLTGVVFVAEYTGQAAFIVPGLVAMTTAVLVVGPRSVSHSQRL